MSNYFTTMESMITAEERQEWNDFFAKQRRMRNHPIDHDEHEGDNDEQLVEWLSRFNPEYFSVPNNN